MRIAIFEEEHFEVLNFYIKIFQRTFGVENVFLITNKKTFNLISNKTDADRTLFTSAENQFENIHAVVDFVNKKRVDVFLYNTIVYTQYKFADKLISSLKKKTKAKLLLTLHNINTLVNPKIFICKNPVCLFKNIVTTFRKKRILRNINAVNVICENQHNYIRQNNLLAKPILNIPPCYWHENEKPITQTESSAFTLAILGKVKENRKDYETVYKALLILQEKLKSFRLLIIGWADKNANKNVIHKFQELQKQFSLSFWHPEKNAGRLDDNELKEVLGSVDVLLCPTNIETTYEGQKEKYGSSKSSGNIYDIVRFHKPAIFPQTMQIPDSLKECVLSYNNEIELAQLLQTLIEEKDLFNNLTKAVNNLQQTFSEDFIVTNTQKQFANIAW